ncbi:MAG TPA: ATP-binding protein [Burkholderiaceae bacterium]|nr:ATP-binding protein [Burkholderiaceae bacterium]
MDDPLATAPGSHAARAGSNPAARLASSAPRPLRTLLQAALLGLVYYLLASPAANMAYGGTLAAIVWPAPAVAIALLWRVPYRRWGAYLLAILLAVMASGTPGALSLAVDFQFAALNVLEVALCAWLGQRYVSRPGELDSMAALSRFVLLLPLLASGAVAALGAGIAVAALPLDWLHEWQVILVGNGLAILVLVPALLAWSRPAGGAAPSAWLTVAPAGVTLALLLVAAGAGLSAEVLRVALSLVLAWAAIYGGLKAASLAVIAATAAGIALTLYGSGAYSQAGDSGIWRLQVDLAGLALLSFFVAIAVRERRELALRLERARRFESLGMLAGGIAHDFNNILAAVGGYVEIAGEQISSASPARAALREVQAAVARGKDMTEQILLAARRGDRQRDTIDLRDVVAEAVGLANPLCRPGVRIELQLPPAPLPVLAHHGQLVRAVLNLLRNATQAARGQVLVTLDGGGSAATGIAVGDAPPVAAWVDVADDGPGIALADMQALFEPFFSTRGSGTGLGLAIVAGIAVEHGGGVQVLRDGAARTHFCLLLPAAPQPDNAELPAPQPGNGERVLLVDADQARRERSEEWLAGFGFEPAGYAEAEAALTALSAAPQEIRLLLLMPPAMRGGALLAAARQIAPGLPVILCGVDLPPLGAPAAAATVVLAAPFDEDALAAAVQCALKEQA